MRHRHEVFAWVAERTGLEDADEEDAALIEDPVMSLEKQDLQNGLADGRG